MGSARECTEQAVLFAFKGEDRNAGNQGGKFIEDIPGKA